MKIFNSANMTVINVCYFFSKSSPAYVVSYIGKERRTFYVNLLSQLSLDRRLILLHSHQLYIVIVIYFHLN